ncbi:HAD family hydrolase [Paenibacillus athensensis]|uniref:Haloacid dehalogenase n=1 Tax=Paenibacillus athensensis TaxID=1967502 RepID=A0A4Y8Q969_9BACL|nr:HAD family hydrolase [Paenibacillus athensensis]MCD1258949.1 HAD family hydrolase [Paenibacillus athensensis]
MSPVFSPSRKNTIFFDMNNTIIDRRQCFDSAFTETIGAYTARWEPDEFVWSPQDALHSYKLEWSRYRKTPVRQPIPPDELRQLCLSKALQPYPVKVTATFARAFFEQVETLEDSYVSLFPGVEETLTALAARYRLAIISNGSAKQLRSNWSKLKLGGWFSEELLFSSGKDGLRKPQPAIFENAIRTLGTSAGQSVMVGNSWRNDIIGATSCGMDAVWIHPGHLKKISQRKLGRQKVVIVRAFRQLQQTF